MSIIVVLTALIFMFPGQAEKGIDILFHFMTNQLGWAYILIAVVGLVFCFWMAFSKYGSLRLGGKDAKKEYGELSWASMMFTAGIGVGVAVCFFSDPLGLIQTPLFGAEPMSDQAIEYTHMYSRFLYGIYPWTMYAGPSRLRWPMRSITGRIPSCA